MLGEEGGYEIPKAGIVVILGLIGTFVLFVVFIVLQGHIVQAYVRTSQSTLAAADAAHALSSCLAGPDGTIDAALLETHNGRDAENVLLEVCGVRVGRDLGVTRTGLRLRTQVTDFWQSKTWSFKYDADESSYGTHQLFVAIKDEGSVHFGRLDVEAQV